MNAPKLAHKRNFIPRCANTFGVLALVLCAGWSGVSSAADARPAKPAPTVIRDAADDWFDKGSAAYDGHRLADAETAFLEAWKLKKTPDIAANLGQVETELGHHRLAATFFSYAVKNAAPTDSQEARRDVRQRLEDALKLVGKLQIRVNPPGANVLLNGEALGLAPLSDDTFAEPGSAVLTAKLSGYTDARAVVQVGKGATTEVVLELVRPVVPQEGANPAIVIGGAATAGVALGVGVLFAVLSTGKANDAKDRGGWDQCYGSTAPSPNNCVELDGLRRNSATFANASFWGFAGGVAIGASTVIYALVNSKKEKAPPAVGLRIAPVPMANGGGLVVGGHW